MFGLDFLRALADRFSTPRVIYQPLSKKSELMAAFASLTKFKLALAELANISGDSKATVWCLTL